MVKTKDLVKCKHPNSRRTTALLKKVKKTKSKEKSKKSTNIKLNLLGEKVAWFKTEVSSAVKDNEKCPPEIVLDLINRYLSRFDDELEQIKIKHSIGNRKNRQHANREDIINMTVKGEKEEFSSCGLEIPDLLHVGQFKLLLEWDGELRFLSNFKLRRFTDSYLKNLINKSVSVDSVKLSNEMEVE